MKCFFFFEKSEFQAGIDQKKCSDVLACIDAEKLGVAYYSLARIGHYYDVRQGNHKLDIETKQGKNGISILIQHGRVKTELAFVDMNEVVGEKGKENLEQKNFSYEDITSVLGNIYTDEDISFVGELAKAADKEAYAQVFKKDPDRLSAVGQEALYQYAYILMSNGVKYDRHLYVTKQDLGQLEAFSNGLLQTLSNKKREDYCERYLKILADKGKYRMNVLEDQMCENYREKEVVISILPEFCLNSQLNIIFSSFQFRINQEHVYKQNRFVQTDKYSFTGYERLLDDSIYYYESIWKNGQEGEPCAVYIDKSTGHWLVDNNSTQEEKSKTALFEDTVTCNSKVVSRGKHDVNAILKEAWLRGEGLSFMAAPEMKEAVKEELLNPSEASQSAFEKMTKEKSFDEDKAIPALYLIWTGEPYVNKNGKVSELDDISRLPVNDIKECMDELDAIAENLGEKDGEIPYNKVDTDAFIKHDFFEE